MKTKWLVIGIILLFVGVTIAPTINFNTVKASQQNIIKERINQRELLFQTIVDIANNKEIQRIILKSQMRIGIFAASNSPVFTKNHLKQMCFVGLILSKFISLSRMQSKVQYQNQIINSERQQEISTIIENNPLLKGEITQLQLSKCDCDDENSLRWNFPLICRILLFFGEIGVIFLFFQGFHIIGLIMVSIIIPLLELFHCI